MSGVGYGSVELEYDENGELIQYYAIRPNKTQIKRDIAELAKLAEQLTQLTESQLVTMLIPEQIEKAIVAVRKMPETKSARKRQMKFITAQLRKIELDLIIENLNRIKTQSAHGVREHHQAEQWRDQLINDQGNRILTELLNKFPNADRQHLRQLQRNAQKQANADKSPKAARILYQYLKMLISH